jgi:hypothetical protein
MKIWQTLLQKAKQERKNGRELSSSYQSTLAASTVIILFFQMLKFSKYFFFKEQFLVRESRFVL